ncbi:MAG: ArsR/SmtB family transcription factor [Gemmatimonadaceae bacterium]
MAAPVVFDRLSALADLTRSRMLLLLERHELTVGELSVVLQLPQSTTSRHLRTLADDGWVSSRAEGTVRWYRMSVDRLDPSAKRLWAVVREQVSESTAVRHDAQRLRSVLGQRREKSREFFSSAAAQWNRVRAELFGAGAENAALLALLDEAWTVGDLGCGTGQLASTLAPFVRRVIGVDESAAMLAAARKRLYDHENVELRKGDLEALPIDDRELDVAVLSLVLHYVVEPQQGLAEARRALKPGGRLLIVDMMPHDREEYRQQMGHVWQGFAEQQLEEWLHAAGFQRVSYRPLPADPRAKGPNLFAASAR